MIWECRQNIGTAENVTDLIDQEYRTRMEGPLRGYRRSSSKRIGNCSFIHRCYESCLIKNDEINSCFQGPLSLKLFKIEGIVFNKDRLKKAANFWQMEH